MVNDIITGISIKLNNIFGDSYRTYDSNIEQGLKEPCFFIKLLTAFNIPYIGKRKKRNYPFDIHFFPEDNTDNASMLDIGDILISELEYITLQNGDILRGRDMSYQIIDGVLHLFCTYSVVLNRMEKEDPMENCEIEVES